MIKEKQNKLLRIKTKKLKENKPSHRYAGSGRDQFTILNMGSILSQPGDRDYNGRYAMPVSGRNFILKVIHKNKTSISANN